MNIKEILKMGYIKLKEENIEDSAFKAEIILCHLLNMNKTQLVINNNQNIDDRIKDTYMELLDKIIIGIPLQYITNMQEFMKLQFYVDENVLIPQPDTETLVEKGIELIKKKNMQGKNIDVLDLCTGSGAIGISIKKYLPNINIYASDISEKALRIAKINAKKNNVEIKFINSDMFSKLGNLKFDLIISNPPYIEKEELKKLPKEVRNEPEIALNGGEDGLCFYRIIQKEAYKFLKEKGIILLEIGYNQSKTVANLFLNNSEYENIEVFNDLANIERVVKIEKK